MKKETKSIREAFLIFKKAMADASNARKVFIVLKLVLILTIKTVVLTVAPFILPCIAGVVVGVFVGLFAGQEIGLYAGLGTAIATMVVCGMILVATKLQSNALHRRYPDLYDNTDDGADMNSDL